VNNKYQVFQTKFEKNLWEIQFMVFPIASKESEKTTRHVFPPVTADCVGVTAAFLLRYSSPRDNCDALFSRLFVHSLYGRCKLQVTRATRL